MKKHLTLLLFAWMGVATSMYGQLGEASSDEVAKMRNYTLRMVLYEQDTTTLKNNFYWLPNSEYLKEAIEKYWTFCPYEFVKEKEKKPKNAIYLGFALYQDLRDGGNWTMCITHNYYSNSIRLYDAYIPSLGLATRKLGKYRIASYVKVLQNTLVTIEQNKLKKMRPKDAQELYGKEKHRLKGMKLYVPVSTFPYKGDERVDISIVEIKEHYPYEVELVTEEQLEKILESEEKNAAYLNTFLDPSTSYLTGWVITTDTAEVLCYETKSAGITSFKKFYLDMLERLADK